MRNRRGGYRSSTPVVVLLIGVILILYILFLPPAQREALLSGAPGEGGGGSFVLPPGSGPIGGGVTLLDKYVGTLRATGPQEVEHSLPTTTVSVSTNTEEVKFIDSLLVRKGAFVETKGELTFNADPSIAKNYLLTFNVAEAKGPLLISLNGHPIFERTITSRSPEPVRLPKEYLQAQNTLTFTTTSTGMAFWSVNTYRLENILVSADITRYENSQAEQHFTLPPEEYEKLATGTLSFVPECDVPGRLSVNVNGQLLYAGVVDCGAPFTQDVAKELLNAGDNKVSFTSSTGTYTIDRIRFTSQLAQQEYPTFYFNLPPDMFAQANVFAGRVVLTLRFTDGNTRKQGSIVVNGFQDSFSTTSYYYQATLDPNVLIPNANSIQLLPGGGTLNIAELRVELLR